MKNNKLKTNNLNIYQYFYLINGQLHEPNKQYATNFIRKIR